MDATYVDATNFTVIGDQTSIFSASRAIQANCAGDGYKYGWVDSSSYAGGTNLTTVTLTANSDALTNNLATVSWASVAEKSMIYGTDDAITKKHTEGADTTQGTQAQDLAMGTHKITGVVDPAANQDAATKKYVDDNAGGGDVSADANLTDHAIVRGDGGAKKVQTSGITIDDAGILTNALQPACRAYLSGDQTIVKSTWTKLQLDVEGYDQNADYDNVTNYRFVAPVDGVYLIGGAARINALVLGKVSYTAIYLNGAEKTYAIILSTGIPFVNECLYLNATDYIELWTYHNDTVNRDADAGKDTFLYVEKLF